MSSLVSQNHDSVPTDGKTSDVMLQLVTFQLLNEEFAMPILDVREIIRMVGITPVPHAPAFVEGVINLRGQIIPVVDLRKRFNLEVQEQTSQTRVIVVDIDGHVLGLIVDGVNEVLYVPSESVSPAPQIVSSGIGAEYIKGIANLDDKMIILIDLMRVFNHDEMTTLDSIESHS